MDEDFEALKKRKEKLELERDIARLERNANNSQRLEKASQWSWKWVGPLIPVGLFFVFGGIADGKPAASLVGLVMLFPALAKIFGKR